jgi:hypothetical protein
MGRRFFGIFHVTPDAHICSPCGMVATKRSRSKVFARRKAARLRVGEQLKRARNGCIGAPAGMQRRQSAFVFFTVCLGSKIDEDATAKIRC